MLIRPGSIWYGGIRTVWDRKDENTKSIKSVGFYCLYLTMKTHHFHQSYTFNIRAWIVPDAPDSYTARKYNLLGSNCLSTSNSKNIKIS